MPPRKEAEVLMYLMERHVLDVTIAPMQKNGKIRVVISASD
jgi:hypothetical protein